MKFLTLSSGPVSRAPGHKILRKDEISSLLDGKELLAKLSEDIAAKLEETQKECEQLREKAIEEGRLQGLEEFNVHLLALEDSAKKIYLDMQKVVLSLALKAAKKIVQKELEMHPDTIVDIVLEALSPAKQNKKVSIFVNKSDKEALEKGKAHIRELLEQVQVLSIQERNDISPGGCIIETEAGIINATTENQWRALELAFERYKP